MIKNGLTIRFAEVGKIKIGGVGDERSSKDGKKWRLPIRYEHFVVTTTEKGPDGNFVIDQAMMKKIADWCGDKEPKEIPIRLPFDSIDLNFWTSFAMYQGSKCVCRGDGETATRITQQGNEQQVKCEPSKCKFLQPDEKGQAKCKVNGILSCHIPLSMEAGAIYRFRTHSWNSVSSILAALQYVQDNTRGILQGLPLKLKFLKKATADHGNVNIVTVVLDGVELMKMRELALAEHKHRTEIGLEMKLLEDRARAAGFLNDTDDPEDVEQEFYGHGTVEEPEPGVSAEEVTEKIKTEPTPTKAENQGSLL